MDCPALRSGAGDAVVMLNPYTGGDGPRIVAGAATADSERDAQVAGCAGATGVRTLLTGHGEPWRGEAAEAVALAQRAGAS